MKPKTSNLARCMKKISMYLCAHFRTLFLCILLFFLEKVATFLFFAAPMEMHPEMIYLLCKLRKAQILHHAVTVLHHTTNCFGTQWQSWNRLAIKQHFFRLSCKIGLISRIKAIIDIIFSHYESLSKNLFVRLCFSITMNAY